MTTWFELPAGIMCETGVLRVLEPADSNPLLLQTEILTGRYGKPFILDDGKVRQLYFTLRYLQSAMRLNAPTALELAYTRKMMGFLLFHPKPKRLLIVGLGGGSLAKFCHRHLSRTRITAVEIDPTVIAMASQFCIPSDERLAIVEADAGEYLPRAEADTDVLMLDGFDAEGISSRLNRPAFYEAARRRLRPRGVLVANLAGSKDDWQPHLDMLNAAFDERVLVVRVGGQDNHIVFASGDPDFPPPWSSLEKPARDLQQRLGLDFPGLLKKLKRSAGR
ncbi:MAG: fused MFS/spermidine synthase [Rhodocyclaceae bacterium]|nr:fused MFS/spermidine synthase [Rhodocyclaceae bacterium]